MSSNLSNSEISEVTYKNEILTIHTSSQKKEIKISEIVDVEVKEHEKDSDPSLIFSALGALAGFAVGDITGAAGGGVVGWIGSKLFGENKIFFLTFILFNEEKITFTAKEDVMDTSITEIKEVFNNYLSKQIDHNITASAKWMNNLESFQNLKKYISFSEVFSDLDMQAHEISEVQLQNKNLINQKNIKLLASYFVNFKTIDLERKKLNQLFIKNNLDNPNLTGLINSQKKAVLTDDDNTLVNAGAGSGKTKTILHKIAYLIDKNICLPSEILILAYNKNVKEELIERIKSFPNSKLKKGLKTVAEDSVYTFHGYGAKQIRDKRTASFNEQVSDFESELRIKKGKELDKIIDSLLADKNFRDNLLTYFSEYFYTYKDYFKDIQDFDDYVKYIRNIGQITLSGIPMRSYEEVEIANYLFINGIKFEYEKEYEGQYIYQSNEADFSIKDTNHLKTKDDKKYHPDFYLTDYNIYLEHFALNKDNQAPIFFKNPSGYYKQYLEKIKVHDNNKTKLITTFSWEKAEGNLLKNLEEKLKKHNVKFNRLSDEQIIDTFKSSGKLSRFTELISTFLSHYKSNELTDEKVKNRIIRIVGDNNVRRCLVFLNLFLKIFNKYQSNLKDENSIDFDDMIIEGRKKLVKENFKYIIVDEFQDISQGRAKFLKAIKDINKSKLYCVGDDWQAINQFSGGDVTIFTLDFKNLFGHFERVDIDTTFRYGNLINNISSRFIQKNPTQLNKTVIPIKDIKDSSISIYEKNVFTDVMNELIKKNKNIYILGRYNLDKYDNKLRNRFFKSNIVTKYEVNNFTKNTSKNITYKTIHAAKGLEADVVCLINMYPGILGFPSQMENDEILMLVLPKPEQFPDAEERRLMYVAMTRARKELHLFSGNGFYASEFVKELKKELNISKTNNFRAKDKKRICPTHKVNLVRRNSYRGPFYACPKFFGAEKCRYTESV